MSVTKPVADQSAGLDHAADPAASILLLDLSEAFIYSGALHLAAQLRIADLLADGPRPIDELATATRTKALPLYSLLRLLASRGVVAEGRGRMFTLTEAGQPLRSDHAFSVRVTVAQAGRITAPAFANAQFALRTGTGAFEQAFGQPVWDYLREHQDEGADFDVAMREHSRIELAAIAEAYDFSGAGTIVDVGGGDGTLLCAVLRDNPGCAGVLFDLPHVVERNRVAEEGLADRCTIVGGDIFSELPEGGDLYLMKSVLHGWTDDQVVAILRGIRSVMRPDGRLLLIERVIPEGDGLHPSKAFDFAMLIMAGGRERTQREYADLLAASGFQVAGVVGTRSALGIVEAIVVDA